MEKTFTIKHGTPLSFKLGENSQGKPVMAFYTQGQFIFQMEFTPTEYDYCRNFFSTPFSGRAG